ncbi:hypothetical protein QFC21_004302 [Naganishia friedmannii]|uniref:Uncharacterized protein n=1 Tax=Naganishia friedmannii TaxID=89922 RepID=A0ACC2VI30_9TREE|nr:hypothetical protein QFC21_004302 [Naganishia friedmannii]
MRHIRIYLIFAALCVLQFATTEGKLIKKSTVAVNIAAEEKALWHQDARPTRSLRQTTWQEIHARQVSSASPHYKRQMASAVPVVYPSCSSNPNPGSYAVARYPQTEIVGGDSYTPSGYLYGYNNATNESGCLRICQGVGGCIGYFYRPDSSHCYVKSNWTPTSFSTTSSGAVSSGAVSGLLTTCAAAASAGVPATISKVCCDANMAAVLTYPTCSVTNPGSVAVARYQQTDYNGGASSVTNLTYTALTEAACLRICQGVSDLSYTADSTPPQSMVGLLGSCNAAMGKGGFKTCPTTQTTGGVAVARYPQTELTAYTSGYDTAYLTTTSADAQAAGSVTGIMGSCINAAVKGISTSYDRSVDFNDICCDAPLTGY